MTRDEAKKLLAILKTAYPYFYNKQTDAEASAAVNLWAAALRDYEYRHINSGLGRLVQTSKFPPTVAEVIESAGPVGDILSLENWLPYYYAEVRGELEGKKLGLPQAD